MPAESLNNNSNNASTTISSVSAANNQQFGELGDTGGGEASSFKFAALSPSIIIVGTNKNQIPKEKDKEEHVRRVFDRIKQFISNRVYAKHIVEPYFAIDSLETLNNKTIGKKNNKRSSHQKKSNDDDDGDKRDDGVDKEGEEEEKNVEEEEAEAEVDANNCGGDIEQLKRVIEQVALNEPYMGEQLPVKWMNFEKSLEKLKNKGLFYASLSQICEIAHEKDIKTQEELTTCLNFFHDLGVIIYYGNANDIFLRNTIILKPQKLVEIFKIVLTAKRPDSVSKYLNELNNSATRAEYEEDPLTGRLIMRRTAFHVNTNSQTAKLAEMWQRYDLYGILDDRLLDILWSSWLDQKPGLLGLMKKFDLICEVNLIGQSKSVMYYTGMDNLNREYLVPSRVTVNYDDEIDDETNADGNYFKRAAAAAKKQQSNGHRRRHHQRRHAPTSSSEEEEDEEEEDEEEEDEDDGIEDLTDYNKNRNKNGSKRGHFTASSNFQTSLSIIEFYYDFCGFLPGLIF